MGTPTASPTAPDQHVVRSWIIRTLIGTVVMAGLLFLAAGTLAWPMAWIYVVSLLVVGLLTPLLISRDLLAERMQRRHAGQKPWDRTLFRLYAVINGVVPLLAGLDRRFGWAPEVPGWIQLAALIFYIAGWAVSLWAMAANPFFALVVRLQRDRGQQVVSQGPYRVVRHPGYVGGVLLLLAIPLLLGSWWASAAGAVGAGLLVARTALEDRTLQAELEGYAAYTRRVRYRLVPGLW